MAVSQEWVVKVDGKEYYVVLTYDYYSLGSLTINGIDTGFCLSNRDERPILIGGKEYLLVVFDGKADLVVDGLFMNSKKEYRKAFRRIWIFPLACFASIFVCPANNESTFYIAFFSILWMPYYIGISF